MSNNSEFAELPFAAGKDIQPVVFTVEASSELLTADVKLLHMPDSLLTPLLYLEAEKNSRYNLPNTVGVRSLNSVVRALFPQVYTALPYVPITAGSSQTGAADHGRRPWLLASRVIEINPLWRLIRTWISTTYSECPSLRTIYGDLRPDGLSWTTVNMDMVMRASANGTAMLNRDAYTVLPAMIAQKLAGVPASLRHLDGYYAAVTDGQSDVNKQSGMEIKVHRERRYLMRVPSNDGAELVSWPPSYLATKNNRVPYSYAVKITAQTIVGDPKPRIHLHYGVRRWVHSLTNADGELVMKTKNYSVFMRSLHPVIGQGDGNSFTVARMRPVFNESGKRVPVWKDNVAEIISLSKVGFSEELRFPNAEELIQKPLDWLDPAGMHGVQAAIAYATVPLYHEIKQGLSLDIHEQITSAIAAKMNGQMELCAPIPRLQPVTNVTRNPLALRLREIDQKMGVEGYRLQALAQSVGQQVTIEIYWQSPKVRDYLAAQVERLLTWDERYLERDTKVTNNTSDNQVEGDADNESTEALPPVARFGALLPEVDPADISDDLGSETKSDFELAELEHDGSTKQKGEEVTANQSAGNGRLKAQRIKDAPPPEACECKEILLPTGGVLRILTMPIEQSGLGNPLDDRGRSRREVRLAAKQRAEEIKGYFAKQSPVEANAPVLALVELPDYTRPLMRKIRHRDPKVAIRTGMMGAGRVTQFVAPLNIEVDANKALDELEHRSEMAVADGLRQLGYMPSGVSFKPRDIRFALPDDLVVAAVWMLRLTHKTAQQPVYMPTVVMMRISEPQVWAWLPDGKSPSVRPYRQALLDMYSIRPESISKGMVGRNLELLKRFILDELLFLGEDVLILVAAQNARMFWNAIANNVVQFDQLQFGKFDAAQSVKDLKSRLRIVRLRSSDRGETPEYYWKGVRPGNSRAGIWQANRKCRLYFSIGDKPKSMARSKRSKEDDPRQYYAIPSILEVVPISLQPGDMPEAWVNAVHQWRKMSYLTNEPTLYPLPMMLAARMDEYAQTIGPRLLPDEWDRILIEDEDDDGDQPGSDL